MRVGIRELQDGLSRHLAEVRRGRSVTATEHGRVIASMVPAEAPTPQKLLITEGRVRPGRKPKRLSLVIPSPRRDCE